MTKRANSEGTVRKRSDGRWEVVLTIEPDGGMRRRKSVYGATQKEALEKADKVRRAVAASMPVPDLRITVGAFMQSWLDETARPSVKPTTYESYGHM